MTGGAGFIGSHFVRHAASGSWPALAGARIVVLDKLTYAGTLANLAAVVNHPRVRVVQGDILDTSLVGDVLGGADLVVHFAAETHVDRSIVDGSDFVATNVAGTQTLLESAARGGVGRFVHISTDEVYGSIEAGSWDERSPLCPRSPYAASKAGSDLLALAHHTTHGLDVVVTRCSNNYGTHQFPEKIIPLFVTNLLDGRPVPLYGDGLHRREWLHVSDHCAAVAAVAERGRSGEVYNVGGAVELSNLDLTELLLDACGADRSLVRHVPDRKGHDRRYSLDSGKLRDELGWAPSVPFDAGLRETVQWYADNRRWWEPLKRSLRTPP